MGDQAPNTDLGPLIGDALTKVNNDILFTDDSALPGTEKLHAHSSSVASWSSPMTAVGNGTCETSPTVEAFFPLPTHAPISPAEAYVRAIMRGMEELQEDGGILKSISRARSEVLPFKDGMAVFEVSWFAAMRDIALSSMKAARMHLQSSAAELELPPDGNAEIDVEVARKSFLLHLGEMTEKMVQRYYYQMFFCRRRFPPELQLLFGQLNERLTQNLLATSTGFPKLLAASSVEELDAVLIHDFDVWISHYFPYFKYAISSGKPMQLIWGENNSLKKEEVAFQVYTTATRVNLKKNNNRLKKGALFPVKWMDELLHWLCSSEDAALPPPGPFDTFQLVELSSDRPVKHILREGGPESDVIPEELFDLFWGLFGGGPKYLVEGVFSMQRNIEERLSPPRVSLAFFFEDMGCQPVVLKRVLHRAEVSEVMRRALRKFQKRHHNCQDSEGGKLDAELWYAALCAENGVNIYVTHVRGVLLEEPQLVSNQRTTFVGDVVGQMRQTVPTETNTETPELQFLLRLQEKMDRLTLEARGVCGLPNIGNTCYMNSALQCLSNIRSMRRALFFLPLSEYVNPVVTREMVCLLIDMWSGMQQSVDTHGLKTAIGRAVSRFDSYEQQDAMEFIEALLDCMHEEMNTVSAKRYREVLDSDASIPTQRMSEIFWKDFLNNNRSFIPHLFFFQTKTRLECLSCGALTTLFENNLSLTATVVTPAKKRTPEVIVLLPTGKRVRLRLKVTCDKKGDVYTTDIVRELTEKFCSENVVAVSTRIHASSAPPFSFYAGDDDGNMNGNISSSENNGGKNKKGDEEEVEVGGSVLDGYRLIIHGDDAKPLPATDELLYAAAVPVAAELDPKREDVPEEQETQERAEKDETRDEEEVRVWYFLKGRRTSVYALHEPCYVEWLPAKVFSDYSSLARHLHERGRELGRRFLKEKFPSMDEMQAPTLDPLTGEQLTGDDRRQIRVLYQTHRHDTSHLIILDESEDEWMKFGGMNAICQHSGESRVLLEYDDFLLAPNESFQCMLHPSVCTPRRHSIRGFLPYFNEMDNAVTLEECLESTYSPDILAGDNARECSKCKARRDSKIERRPFLMPPCLIISLKRFRVHMEEASKNNTRVAFPMELDMAPYMDPESPVQNAKYSLRGVVTHRGGINHGHYTATALNDSCKRWVQYDDWRTSFLEGPSTKDAFILCYERNEVEEDRSRQSTGETSRL
ncbi:hypothetical protein ECC02_004025 [Trypanosoma cruzi]|uniref:Ubiquitin hydrolase n=1 Tax=Trypanosoma cruzi TaxID=5693 RepID=A0A7J6Y8D2_TRYCR|nr:hypothetical protein ECC02_004025 [Trypanosoma cruzi]